MDVTMHRAGPRLVAFGLAAALAALSGWGQIALAEESTSPAPTMEADVDTQSELFSLPSRPGPTPSVTEGIPHIQLDQTSSPEVMDELATWVFSLPSVVELPSAASLPGARALTLAEDQEANQDALIVGREFAHIHADPGAGSMHLRLPEDIASIVIDAGWGVWHPFAVDGTMPGMVMVWAPRDAEDLEAIKPIVEASVEHARG